MRALLLSLTRRDNGHYVSVWRTPTGGQQVHVIPSGTDLETAIPSLQKRLDQSQVKEKP